MKKPDDRSLPAAVSAFHDEIYTAPKSRTERAEEVKVHASAEISPDPKDDAFCICAQSGKADFIVTLNLKDFPQHRLKAKVVSPGGGWR